MNDHFDDICSVCISLLEIAKDMHAQIRHLENICDARLEENYEHRIEEAEMNLEKIERAEDALFCCGERNGSNCN